jgi:hypothetical protein
MTTPKKPQKPQTVDIPWHRQPIMIPVVGVLLIAVMCGFRWGPDNSSAEPPQIVTPEVTVEPAPVINEIVVHEQQVPNEGLLIDGNRNKVEIHFHRYRR